MLGKYDVRVHYVLPPLRRRLWQYQVREGSEENAEVSSGAASELKVVDALEKTKRGVLV